MNTRRLVGALGAALAGIGTILPWASANAGFASFEVNGIEGDGVFVLGAALVGGLAALAGTSSAAGLLVILAGAVAIGIPLFDLSHMQGVVDTFNEGGTGRAAIGVGLYLCIAGGVIMVFSGIIPAAKERPVTTTSAPGVEIRQYPTVEQFQADAASMAAAGWAIVGQSQHGGSLVVTYQPRGAPPAPPTGP